jgi:endonuclease YncB( thermonuclease family)
MARRLSTSLAAILLAWALSAAAETLTGRVVGVADGDTITLLDGSRQQHKIRIGGIDAPEKGQPFGARSKQHLSDLSHGRAATADCHKRDRYGREVCTVYVDGLDVGLAQLDAGMAWWFRRYANEQPPQQRIDYESAEDRAAADRAGLWQDPNPVPPWEWRKARRRSQ